jgi:uncharacterized YigZ family protein
MPLVATFRTLYEPAEAERRDRGSRFLARIIAVRCRDDAHRFHAEQQQRFCDATHVAAAVVLADGTALASDAGEPAGSAGPPQLAAIRTAGLVGVASVVIRYYGGTNLGVGGLIRAYGGVTSDALADATTITIVTAHHLTVRYPYERTGTVLRVAATHGAQAVTHHYDEQARVEFTLPDSTIDAFCAALRDATQGAVQPDLGEPTTLVVS